MITDSVSVRRAVAAGSLAAATVLVAACGPGGGNHPASAPTGAARSHATSASPSGTAPSPATGPASSPSATPGGGGQGAPGYPQCKTPSLSVKVAEVPGGGTAGSTYMPIDFTNVGHGACVIYGFPGVSFVTGRGGSQIGAAASRVTQYSAEAVTLRPGGSAHAWLQVAQAGNYPPSVCKPATAHWLRVFPPNNKAAAYVSHTFAACSSAKANLLSVLPARPGRGRAGQVP